MLHDPSSLSLIQHSLASTDGAQVSNCLFLVLHLLWDHEWRDVLLQMPLEVTCIKWAAFSMSKIIERSKQCRKSVKLELMDRFKSCFQLNPLTVGLM